MTNSLYGNVVIITGATSGIGQAVARRLAQAGCRLVLAARRLDRLEALARELDRLYSADCLVQQTDLSQSQSIEGLVNATLEHFGRIDILFSNAGYGDFMPFDANQWTKTEDLFRVNVFGMMYLSQLVAIQQLEQGGPGQLVLVGSMAGKIPTAMTSVYAASKAAIIAYADALRLELYETPLKVTTVNPGPIKTPFFDRSTQMQAYAQAVDGFSLTPEVVADRVVENLLREQPRRELNFPWQLATAAKLYQLFPGVGDFLTARLFNLKGDAS